MNRTEKQTAIDALTAKLSGASSIYVTDYAGLNVHNVTELRRRLRRAVHQMEIHCGRGQGFHQRAVLRGRLEFPLADR